MNTAQALISLGNGCYEWAEDSSPQLVHPLTGERGPCLLAFELCRMPTFRVGMLKFREYSNKIGTFSGPARAYSRPPCGYRQRHALSQEQKQEVRSAQMRVIEAATGKLTFEQICRLAGCNFNQTTRRILQELIEAKDVGMVGRGRAARYWFRRDR